MTQPRHQPVLPDPGRPTRAGHQEGRVVALAELSQRDDDGGKAKDDVKETHDDKNCVDQHCGLSRLAEAVDLPVLSPAVGSVGVLGQARGRVDDHRHGGDERAEA